MYAVTVKLKVRLERLEYRPGIIVTWRAGCSELSVLLKKVASLISCAEGVNISSVKVRVSFPDVVIDVTLTDGFFGFPYF